MQKTANRYRAAHAGNRAITQIVLVMKLTMLFLTAAFLNAYANGHSQTITFSGTNVPLEEIFKEVKKQTRYVFFFKESNLKNAAPVTISAINQPLNDFLAHVFKYQPLSFKIQNKTIVVKLNDTLSEKSHEIFKFFPIKGIVRTSDGRPLSGVNIVIKSSRIGTVSDAAGAFSFNASLGDIMVFSFVGYETREIYIKENVFLDVLLKISSKGLDETMVIGYGTTTKRYNTSSVGKVTADEISRQPISNPIAALHGRVPGLIVTETSGIPGAAFKIELRGRTSIAQGSDPLYIIDGVPFAPANEPLSRVVSIVSRSVDGGGISPFNSLNPADIESIEVLKDADATSIYGSRGSNGVVLISTKRGHTGKSKLSVNIYTGISKVARQVELMNTNQYLEMRREAFTNDGVVKNNTNAYDLLLFDTTRYTDFTKMLTGGTAKNTDGQISVSGGSSETQYILGGGFNSQTTVFPGDMSSRRLSFKGGFSHRPKNGRFNADFNTSYSHGASNLIGNNPVPLTRIAPNHPDFLDKEGDLVWQYNGFTYFANPFSYLKQNYSAKTENMLVSLQLEYKVVKNLNLKLQGGYNTVITNELGKYPLSSFNPSSGSSSSSSFGNNNFKSWSVEPQLSYKLSKGNHHLNVLVGASLQNSSRSGLAISGNEYANDGLLGSLNAAGFILSRSNTFSEYRYSALFGRVGWQWKQRYLVNFTGRRDGSSRFGPGRGYSNFGGAGIGWIFSEESFMHSIPIISFAKLRGSVGTTGNDKIPDYKYLDSWVVYTGYNGSSSLVAQGLYNPEYGWESNLKSEIALELGLWKDALFLTFSAYRNRSGNQLIEYQLPSQVGAPSFTGNFPAVVQNQGIEAEVKTMDQRIGDFTWSANFNISFGRNKLRRFNNLETSSYKTSLIVGEPLSIYRGYRMIGINTQIGVYSFADKDGKPTSSPLAADIVFPLGNTQPDYYGGMGLNAGWKGLRLNVFLDYRKQQGANFLAQIASSIPGTANANLPIEVLDRWRQPGDIATFPSYTQLTSSASFKASAIFAGNTNDWKYSDASFIRLRNLSISYELPQKLLKKIYSTGCSFYLRGQNLFTITAYRGADPENQNLLVLPPLRSYTAGISFTL